MKRRPIESKDIYNYCFNVLLTSNYYFKKKRISLTNTQILHSNQSNEYVAIFELIIAMRIIMFTSDNAENQSKSFSLELFLEKHAILVFNLYFIVYIFGYARFPYPECIWLNVFRAVEMCPSQTKLNSFLTPRLLIKIQRK